MVILLFFSLNLLQLPPKVLQPVMLLLPYKGTVQGKGDGRGAGQGIPTATLTSFIFILLNLQKTCYYLCYTAPSCKLLPECSQNSPSP